MKKIALLLCAFMLSGCGWMKFWDREEDVTAPAKLERFEEEVRLRTAWSRNAGKGQDPLFSSLRPALGDDTLYVADSRGRVVAIDTDNGRVRWDTRLDTELSGGVGYGFGVVVVADIKGRVYTLDAADGRERWRKTLSSEILATPAVNTSSVFVQTRDARLTALAIDNGENRWRHDADKPNLTLRTSSSPVATENTVVAGFANGKVVAFNANNGALQWENRVGIPQGRTELERMVDVGGVVRDGDIIYATGYQGRAAAMTRGTGRELWYQDHSSYRQPGVSSGHVYVVNEEDHVKALRANSGQTLWTNDQLQYRRLTAPVYANGYVAVGDQEGYLHLLSTQDGRFVGRTRVDRSGLSAPMVADDNYLYVLGNGGRVRAYRFEER